MIFSGRKIILGICIFLSASLVYAGNANSVFSITPANPGSNIASNVNFSGGSSRVFRYQVINNSNIARRITLESPRGVVSNYYYSLVGGNSLVIGPRSSQVLGVRMRDANAVLSTSIDRLLTASSVVQMPVVFCAGDEQGNPNPFLCSKTAPENDVQVTTTSAISPPLLAVGAYQPSSTNQNEQPLLGVSQDKGASWSVQPSGIPTTSTSPVPTYTSGAFFSVGCNQTGNVCVAAGNYTSVSSTTPATVTEQFLLAVRAAGSSWSYPAEVTNPTGLVPAFQGTSGPQPALMQPTCHDSTCIIGGSYTDTSNVNRFVIAAGQYDGVTKNWAWSFPTDVTTPQNVIPPFASEATPLASSAYSPSTGNYLAAGSYYSDASPSIQLPFLVVSNQGDTSTWSTPSSFSNAQAAVNPTASSFSNLPSISCSQGTTNYCIAVGSYTTPSFVATPFAAVNTAANNNTDWTYPTTFTQPQFDSGSAPQITGGFFTASACDDAACAIIGAYGSSGSSLLSPFLAFTWNTGQNWTFPYSFAESALSAGAQNLNSVAVLGDSKIVVVGNTSSNQFFVSVGSIDSQGNASWTFPSVQNLPSDLQVGDLLSVYCQNSSNTCIAGGNYGNGSQTRPALILSNDGGNTWTFSDSMTSPDNTGGGLFSVGGAQ